MEVDSSPKRPEKLTGKKKRRRTVICLSITAVILALGLLILILALTVFKAKHPVTAVNSIAVSDLKLSVDVLRIRVSLNLTIDADVTVRNPNRVSFKYDNSTCLLRYGGDDVGEVPIPEGKLGARDTRALNLTMTLMADRLLSRSDFFADVMSGTVPFQTYIKMSGKVRILFNIHMVSYTTCDLVVDLSERKVSDQKCRYKTKL